MLGNQLVRVFRAAGHDVLAAGRRDLDITDRDEVLSFVENFHPDVIINAAAYNFVDKIEEPEVYPLAFAINAQGPRNLAVAAEQVGALMIHYGTDYVFDGQTSAGYAEDDAPHPISKYGETKLAGERAVQESIPEYYIIRVAKLFGPPGTGQNLKESFPALMVRLSGEKPELTIVNEEFGTPAYAPDVALATLEIIKEKTPYGIYHFINEGEPVTWYGFAKEIFEAAGVATPYRAVTSADFDARPAKRPANSSLKNTKFKKLRSRIEALKEFLGKI